MSRSGARLAWAAPAGAAIATLAVTAGAAFRRPPHGLRRPGRPDHRGRGVLLCQGLATRILAQLERRGHRAGQAQGGAGRRAQDQGGVAQPRLSRRPHRPAEPQPALRPPWPRDRARPSRDEPSRPAVRRPRRLQGRERLLRACLRRPFPGGACYPSAQLRSRRRHRGPLRRGRVRRAAGQRDRGRRCRARGKQGAVAPSRPRSDAATEKSRLGRASESACTRATARRPTSS